jgi:molecular chaperone GrpE
LAKKSKKQEAPERKDGAETPEEEIAAEILMTDTVDPLVEEQNEIDAARTEASRNWDLYLRERADLENARKRHQRDKEDAIRFANDRLLKEMIPVLDNLERAIEHAGQSEGDRVLLEGVNMTIIQFRKALEDFGVKPISSIGSNFDPDLHQAMGQIESVEQAPNTVVTEFQKGYLLHNRLLRPALVIIAKAPSNATVNSNATDPTAAEE